MSLGDMVQDRIYEFTESIGQRDLVEITILAVAIFIVLRFLGRTRSWGMVRGLGLVVVGTFLIAQVVVSAFELTQLAKVFDYLLTTVFLGLLVIFQPELRSGLLLLGRYRWVRWFAAETHPIADTLADAAEALSRECVGALIGIQRDVALTAFIETGEVLDAEVSASLIRTVFMHRTPLHDGAMIISNGRIAAAGCQLPLGQVPEGAHAHMGMRHRAGLSLSEETDAVVLIVSEETGRISLAIGGKLEPVPRDNLSRRLASVLNQAPGAAVSQGKAA